MDATDITATLTRPAEEATSAWLAAARDAGLVADVASLEVDDVNTQAAIVETRDGLYVLEVRQDEVRAVPTHPAGPRCAHEGRHDYVDGRCTLAPSR